MARFNSSLISNTITGTTSVGSPFNGSFTALTGTAPYTVTLANPTLFPGINQQFYNGTGGTVTLSTPAGNFVGAGGSAASTFPVYAGNVVSITADGTNYIVISEDGSALTATSATISGVLTVQSSGGVAIAPSTTGTIDNVNVGATTRGSGSFNTLTANNAVTFTANTASSTTGTGTVVITGGLGVSGTINATSVSASLTGTIQTAAQANITSVGTLSSLTVSGNILSQAATTASAGSIQVTSGDAAIRLKWTASPVADKNTWDIRSVGNGATPYLQFRTINDANTVFTDRVAFTNDGNVGIGTPNPTTRLQVNNAGDSRIIIYETGTTPYTSTLELSSQGIGTYGALLQYTSSAETLTLKAYGRTATGTTQGSILFNTKVANTTDTTVMTIHGFRGNVGIGTTSPSYKLEVVSEAGDNSPFTVRRNDWQGGEVRLNLALQYAVSGYISSGITEYVTDTGYIALNYKSGTSTYAEGLRVSNTGKVGIGTTIPRVKLAIDAGSVAGVSELVNLHNQSTVSGHGTSLTFSGYNPTSSHPTWRFAGIKGLYDTTSSGLNSGGWGGQLRLFVNRGGAADQFEDVVTITGGGNVGIGTANPTATLTVKGQTNTAPWLAAERNGSATLQFKIVGAEDTGYTASTGTVSPVWTNVIDSNNSNIMLSTLLGGGTGGKIILDGNVGIGTNNPTFKLHVNGTSSFEDTVKHKRFTTHVWDGINGGWYPFGADTTARYEIAKIAIDYNDWNGVGQTIIEINQVYYSTGGYSKWAVNYGYVQNSKVTLLETNSDWSGASVTISSPVQVSGDVYYISVYVNVYGYHQQVVKLTTSVNVTTDNITPPQGSISLQKSPTAVNLGAGSSGLSLPEYSETNHNHKINGRLATNYYAHNWLFGNERFVQMRGGKRYGTGTYSLFTRGNGSAQSSGKVYVQAIYSTPSTAGSWEYVISGDKNISQIVANTSIYAGATPSIYWSGDTLYASNSNGSTYYTVIVELHNIGIHWDATFGDFPGFLS